VINVKSDYLAWQSLWKNQDRGGILGIVHYDHARGLPHQARNMARSIIDLKIDVLDRQQQRPMAGTILDHIGPGVGYDLWLLTDESVEWQLSK
jgi:hypothetical protein